MITRFDHSVIGVRDLEAASDAFRRLGFDVRPGGRHTGLGTHNALIRFGVDYLELLATHDPSEAAQSGRRGLLIHEFLGDRPGGLLGFALASSNLDEEYARGGVPAMGYEIAPPFAMERARPDGHVLRWRLLVPGAHTWRRPWPFLIQWDTPDAQRLTWDGVGQHANGVTGVAGLMVATRDLDAIAGLYRDQLGLRVASIDELDEARRARLQLPDQRTIDFLQPRSSSSRLAQFIQDEGEGLVEIRLRVSHLSTSRKWFETHGIRPDERSASEFGIHPTESLGARLVFGT
jgi:catechol 2,3-dioxygenase-like lactoylglutathione lyase family enzyme